MRKLFNDIKSYNNYAMYVARANLLTDVNTSYLGWFWWILEPLLKMLVYYIVYGFVFQAKEEHFECFIFIGVILWDFFNTILLKSVNLVKSNKQIVTRVYIPKSILLLCELYKGTSKFLFGLIIEFLMVLILRIQIRFSVLCIVPLFLSLCLFVFGISLVAMHYGVFINDISHALGNILRVLMYFSGIFYSIENRFPSPLNTLMPKINPVAFYVSSIRGAILYGSTPSWLWLVIWTVVSLLLIKIGTVLIYKYENSYAKVI